MTEEVAPAPAEEAAPAEPVYTLAQENALESAQSYLDLMPFSRQGLIDRLILGIRRCRLRRRDRDLGGRHRGRRLER